MHHKQILFYTITNLYHNKVIVDTFKLNKQITSMEDYLFIITTSKEKMQYLHELRKNILKTIQITLCLLIYTYTMWLTFKCYCLLRTNILKEVK